MSTYRNFEEFFKKATKHEPYPYQKRLAETDDVSVINMPTGTGKTEAAILGLWLWKKINDKDIPRRLVYCLPMRVLVEQTRDRIKKWMNALGEDIEVEVFMGGSENKIRDIHPNKSCIILGTQDMLISAALNRAYGNSPYAWPIAFGLLNNDCMWIMDEVQIMENALPTSIQLDCFRNEFGTYGQHKTVWMSATINPEWMRTVNSDVSHEIFRLEKGDINDELKKRNESPKTLRKAPISLKKTYDKQDVEKLLKLHQDGTVTIIMINNVRRAQEMYGILTKLTKTKCRLIHSRFRPMERKQLNEWLGGLGEKEDVIIVATQVLEAGVDVSAKTMITELAPWSNMVQRFGRCNRYGEHDDSRIYWIDVSEKDCFPYDKQDMDASRVQIKEITGGSVSPDALPDVKQAKFFDHVLRRKDMMELFDTSPDLMGNRIDVARFVRNGKKHSSVSVYWRENADDCITDPRFKPTRDELCEVPIYEIKEFFKKKKHGHVWNFAERKYERVNHINVHPGQTILVDCKNGGYSEEQGWDSKINNIVCAITTDPEEPESHGRDQTSELSRPVTLENHTKHVCDELEKFLKDLPLETGIKNAVRTAAKYHDVGKAHPVFQESLRRNIIDWKGKVWAKSQKQKQGNVLQHSRPGFRHEVASALAYLEQGKNDELKDLITYLIMSHHGKVRLSLRSVSKKERMNHNGEYLLGIKVDGDELPEFTSRIVSIKKTQIDMDIAGIGQNKYGESWVERTMALLEEYRPFRLACLEAVLRRADTFASSKEDGGYPDE